MKMCFNTTLGPCQTRKLNMYSVVLLGLIKRLPVECALLAVFRESKREDTEFAESQKRKGEIKSNVDYQNADLNIPRKIVNEIIFCL